MRVVLFSDIHGNLAALDALLADIKQEGPFDHMVIAGDLAWAGPWPAQVIDRIRGLDAAVIQGNTDAFVARSPQEGAPEDKEVKNFLPLLEWTKEQLGPERTAYLAGLPFEHRISPGAGHDLLVVHANPKDQEQHIAPELSDADLEELLGSPGSCDWEALAVGHLHIPYTRRWHDKLLIDVSGGGLPMDRDRRAAYTVLTWDSTAWGVEAVRRVPYPVPEVVHAMQTCGMPRAKHFADRLLRASYA